MTDTPRRLRVLTWNVHGCVGRDGRHDVERVGAWVSLLAPDLAAFQEVDSRRKASGRPEIYDHLLEQVGEHGHEAWSLSGADGRYGQMLASRFPLHDRQVHDISVGGREPRRVMEAWVGLPGMALRVIATHLGLRRGERQRQTALLREIIMANATTPTLLLGDFNEWRRVRKTRDGLADLFDDWTRHPSFPSRFPVLPLDRIWCRPGSLLNGSRAATEAHMASDHLPIVADLTVPSTDAPDRQASA